MSLKDTNTQGDDTADQNKITAAARIAELNDIDKSLIALLKSAGAAVQVLANTPTSSAGPANLESQKESFARHSSEYFSTLSSIEVRLRRQVYALEEAGLVSPGDPSDVKRGSRVGRSDETGVSGGGFLDASWLNAQASQNVGKGMEKELWAQGRDLVEKHQAQGVSKSRGSENVQSESDDDRTKDDSHVDG